VKGGKARIAGQLVETANAKSVKDGKGRLEIGIRPEFVQFAKKGLPVDVVKVSDAGRFRIVETKSAGGSVKLLVKEGETIPAGKAHLAFDPAHTRVYEGSWMAGARR
jgi:glycerol transport system ATP-binding protein